MKFRSLSVFAAVALLAACTTPPEEGAGTGGAGAMGTAGMGAGAAGEGVGADGMGQAGPAAGSVQEFREVVGDRVFFATDAYTLSPEAQAALRRQAAWLQQYPGKTVLVEGHADERGTREYNLALGERRANSAKDFLVLQGVPANNIQTVSYGKERPVCVESTPDCWQQNRRAVTVIR
ncbi:peptidoglycan-associated lipoprotein Pal [Caenispirillum salinarum]|uniref:peptidoglycan-associated lipoprotein Pal n=1 Tax=Caenispirillum salinarum TaxID=859058 RepID=UPI00384AFCCD